MIKPDFDVPCRSADNYMILLPVLEHVYFSEQKCTQAISYERRKELLIIVWLTTTTSNVQQDNSNNSRNKWLKSRKVINILAAAAASETIPVLLFLNGIQVKYEIFSLISNDARPIFQQMQHSKHASSSTVAVFQLNLISDNKNVLIFTWKCMQTDMLTLFNRHFQEKMVWMFL